MYNLGEQFKFKSEKAIANPKVTIKGNKYRITVLSDILIRLEYSETGTFEDRPTTKVINRNFDVPDFSAKEENNVLIIETNSFKLFYNKEKPFIGTKMKATANLKIDLLGTDKEWYYGHPEARVYKSPDLTDEKDNMKYVKSLFSLDGFVSFDDSKSPIINEDGTITEREGKSVDTYVLLYGKDFNNGLKNYFDVTGKPALIPRYALGNWWSRNTSYDDASLNDLIMKFEKKEIPLSILLLNHDWHLRKYDKKDKLYTGFTFNSLKYKDPKELINSLHMKGIRIGLSINPEEGIYPYDSQYEKAREYLTTDKSGVIPFNVLDPKILDVYLKFFIHPLDNLGVDFYFTDFEKIKDRNMHFNLNHYHFYDMMRDYKRRPMILSKNSGDIMHRYPVVYAGKSTVSWETLKKIPFMNGSASNMGVSFWSHDIGGYHKGAEDNELYTRFVQLGTFSPILKFGADAGKYYKREPWRWSVKTYEIVKYYLNLRHRLIPYLYTEAYNYHVNGVPLITPIYHKIPDLIDDELYRNQYYLGSQLFISPITNKKDYVMNRSIHRIFMPQGTWYDFVTGKKFPGGKKYVAFFKDDEYPVFAKEGSILVFGDNHEINDTTPPSKLEVHIFPGKSNSYTLYEDDGLSDLYKKGFFIKTNIDYNYLPSNYTVIVRAIEGKTGIIPPLRNYKFRFRNTKESKDVAVYLKDVKISHKSYVDGQDFIVEVKNVDTLQQLTINCKGKDIEIDAIRIINEEIESILSDLQIETEMKEKIDGIFFSELPIKKKRIEVRKLKNKGLESKFVKLFLKLLEYINAM
jgi:Alpha-glucosidases, family 31 of glycosyl hydrolases